METTIPASAQLNDFDDGCTAYVRISAVRLAVVEVNEMPGLGWWVARAFVPKGHRGQGIGSMLMRAVADWADRRQRVLTLAARPYDGASRLSDLIRFYERHGFRVEEQSDHEALMFRLPNPAEIARIPSECE